MSNQDWISKLCSPSRLDNFAKYLAGYKYNFVDAYEEYSTDDFIDSLLRIEDPTKFNKADAGTSFHELIEIAKTDWVIPSNDLIKMSNGWTVIVSPDLDIELSVPVVREAVVKANISGFDIRGRVDSIDAIAVHDIKTTSQINFDNYINSWQWKTYLAMTGLDKFIYDIFKVKVDESEKIVTIQEYEKLEVYSYPEMQQEVEGIIKHYHDTLLMLESRIIARVNDYNNQINQLIEQLQFSQVITAKPAIDSMIEHLKTKFISVKGLTNDKNL